MIEILIDESDWSSNKGRLKHVLNKLKNSGWEKFGNNGTFVLFKDVSLNQAKDEMKNLGINEFEPEEWKEELF